MKRKIIFNKENIKKIIILNLIYISIFLIPVSVGTTKVPFWWEYVSWLYSKLWIAILILILIVLNIIITINCPLFQLINSKQQKIIEELIKQDKPTVKYALIQKVKGLSESTGYKNIKKLVEANIVSEDKNGELYINEKNKRLLEGDF